ncbi:hypothetical protein [Legionella waltersii]|uniref:Uncharacterized protein n=1 Tax=Legionella waltersii TaxID=66969 RepID=A0A0W1AAS6_9GAMM|nr:hypothetical protein [Legionella waltersii]KTD78450.1 hypothetical protein Lwal_1885 [Legionella waltersii]SNV05979.1 Uncharacterised protein [Legionella waltersii]
MNYQKFKAWVLEVTKLYGADKDLAPHFDELLQIINSPLQENNQPKGSTTAQIRAKLSRIVQIAGNRDKPLTIEDSQGESAGKYYHKFSVKSELEEFIESYPKSIVEANVDVQKPLTSNSQPLVSTQELAKPLLPSRNESQPLVHHNPQRIDFTIREIVNTRLHAKMLEVKMDDTEWHKLFIEKNYYVSATVTSDSKFNGK